ncbi:hypothetical protein [Microbulbifer sp. GL-2]|uniref:hypothetical protein n=1 Tax=Microbulbifer sp. GL-2 TaxID=2591606 RepID=UPI0011637908|nr:hypothetical protein [Microbulbifer sp. GL-2]BBM03580.1 hypothetical protein GL2_36540 [Microbulbifer sp. GL-2]
MSKYINSLLEVLKILASSAQVQLRYLNGLGNPSVDELALDFDDLFLMAPSKLEVGELTSQQFKNLEDLNSMFDQISGVDRYWTASSLSEDREWEEIRKLASVCLRQFN